MNKLIIIKTTFPNKTTWYKIWDENKNKMTPCNASTLTDIIKQGIQYGNKYYKNKYKICQ